MASNSDVGTEHRVSGMEFFEISRQKSRLRLLEWDITNLNIGDVYGGIGSS